jgi:hypothetical protein
MSNTYFKIQKEIITPGNDIPNFPSYTNNFELTLTAFVGNDHSGKVQLTVQTRSSLPNQSGVAYYTLNDKEIDLLIAGLLERKLGIISATADNQSIFSPANE